MSELDSISTHRFGSNEVEHSQRFYGALPLIVLTADDGPQHTRGMPPKFPKSQAVAVWKVWKSMHDQLAAYSSVGVNIVVHNTGHYIQQDRPDVVIWAVDKVLDQVRSR